MIIDSTLPRLIDVADAARRLAQSKPEYVYEPVPLFGPDQAAESCVYVTRGDDDELCGSCIVGQAFIQCGIDPRVLYDFDHGGADSTGVHELLEYLGYPHRERDGAHAYWLSVIQIQQDKKVAWGEALEVSDELADLDRADD